MKPPGFQPPRPGTWVRVAWLVTHDALSAFYWTNHLLIGGYDFLFLFFGCGIAAIDSLCWDNYVA